MQTIRKYASVALVFALIALSDTAFASPREQDGPRAHQPRQTEQNKGQKPPKGLIAAILDYLDNHLSIPPG